MAITNYDSIISARSSGQYEDPYYFKSESITPLAAGQWVSLFRAAGVPSSITITSAAGGVALCSTHAGALPLTTNSTAMTRYMLSAGVGVASNAGFSVIQVVDVLWGISGIPYTGASYAVNSTAVPLTRSTDGVGVQLMVVMDASHTSATNTTATVTYTNSAGTTGRTVAGIVMTTASRAHHIRPAGYPFLTLMAGDQGVKSVESISFNATIGAGACSIFMVKPLMSIPTLGSNQYCERDATLQIEGLTQLRTGTDDKLPFIGLIGLAAGTGANTHVFAQIRTVYG
jgi:hypothetical protein